MKRSNPLKRIATRGISCNGFYYYARWMRHCRGVLAIIASDLLENDKVQVFDVKGRYLGTAFTKCKKRERVK